MKLQIRDLLLSVIAAVILPLLFVAIEGAMARYSASGMVALRSTVGDRMAMF